MSAIPATPLVSVVMATYNRSELLPYSIGSVQRQSCRDWELIVVGDGCTDDTAATVGRLAAGDPRIRFVGLSERVGEQSGPNNHGVELARGRYLAFLNHDDLWLSDHLVRGIEALEQTRADVVFPLPMNIDRHGVPRLYRMEGDNIYHPQLYVPASFWVMRRALAREIGAWRLSWKMWGMNPSQDFLYRCWKAGRRLNFHRRVTCLVLSSGDRPNGYRDRNPAEIRRWAHRLEQEPDLVVGLLTELAVDSAGRKPRFWRHLGDSARAGLAWLGWRLCLSLGGNPQAVLGFLRFRRKGEWMRRLHAFRGLPPIEPTGR